MSEIKIKVKKLIFDLVENMPNDVELGFAVRKLMNGLSILKKERKTEKPKKSEKKLKHSKKLKPMPELGIPHSKESEESEFLKNEKVLNLFCDVSSYLNGYTIEKIELILEGIDSNFVETYHNDILVSKNWEGGNDIYLKLIQMVMKSLFFDSDETGFPLAQKFSKIYLGKNKKSNTKDIVVYFLKNCLQTKLQIKKTN